jgi:hypothetical protein
MLLVSPAAVGLLALTTTWALEHDPQQATATQSHRTAAASDAATVRLRGRLQAAAREVQREQVSALRLTGAVTSRSDRVQVLAARIRAAGHNRTAAVSTAGGTGGAAVVVPPPVSLPTAPQVSTTTGAS